LACALLFLIIDSIGFRLSKAFIPSAQRSEVFQIFLGLAAVIFATASAYTGFKTAALFILVAFAWLLAFKKLKHTSEEVTQAKQKFDKLEYLIMAVVSGCAVIIHYSFKNGQTFSHFIDHYNYSDLVTYIGIFNQESSFIPLESQWFGGGFNYMFYHFYEIYLTLFFKLVSNETNAKILFYYTYPFMLSITLISVYRYLKNSGWMPSSYLAFLFVICLGTIGRITLIYNAIPLLFPDSELLALLTNFHIYFITNTDFHYLYEYFKVSGGLFFVILLFEIFRKSFVQSYPILIVVSYFLNPLFTPFLLLIIGIQEIAKPKVWMHVFASVVCLAGMLALYHWLNINSTMPKFFEPNGLTLPAIHAFDIIIGFKNTLINFLYSHFTLLLFSAVILVFIVKLPMRLAILGFILVFPLVLYFINILLIPYLVGLIAIGLYLLVKFKHPDRAVVLQCLAALLVLFFIDLLLKDYPNYYQFLRINLYVSYYIVPILLFKHAAKFMQKPVVFILFSALFLGNVAAIYAYQNRVYFRTASSLPFVNRVLEKNQYLTKAGFITDYEPYPYFYLKRPGVDIQNETDSLLITSVSLLNLSKSDSALFSANDYWSYYQTLPVVQFQKRLGPNISSDSAQIAFIKNQNIRLVLRQSGVSRSLGNFMNSYIEDSTFNEIEHYWVYYLNFDKK